MEETSEHDGELPERESDDAISLGTLEGLVGYHLRRASGVFRADFARTMDDIGMRQVLLGILSIIAANPGVNQGAVGRVLGIKRANMVALINEVVDRGYVDRHASPSDRRAFELALTPAGKAILDECRRRIAEHEERLLTALSASERALLIDMLQRIEV